MRGPGPAVGLLRHDNTLCSMDASHPQVCATADGAAPNSVEAGVTPLLPGTTLSFIYFFDFFHAIVYFFM
jgi:hypothetical protein